MSAKQRYEAALAAGDLPAAEAELRTEFARSGDLGVLVTLGFFLRRYGRLAEALGFLESSREK